MPVLPAVLLVDPPAAHVARWTAALRRAGHPVLVGSSADGLRGDVVALTDVPEDASDADVVARVGRTRAATTVIRLSTVLVDLDAEVVSRDGETVPLTAQEAALLRVLAAADGAVVDRDRLLREAWGHRVAVVTRAVDNAVARLRTKVEPSPGEPVHLLTERGAGYRLVGVRHDVAPTRPALHRVAAPASVVGREREIDAVAAALAPGSLVTVTGPPGSGKSTVARAAAARKDAVEADGFRDLVAPTGTVVLVDDADVRGVDASEGLADALSRGLALLATSRGPLRAPGERRIRVGPLPPSSADALARQRGLSSAAGLDGLPLAIELAASAGRVLTPAELARRLASPLDLLVSPARRPERHRRWADVVAASLRRLPTEDRRFAAWAAARPSFALADADWERVAALSDASMLERDGDRFRMLPLIAAAVLAEVA